MAAEYRVSVRRFALGFHSDLSRSASQFCFLAARHLKSISIAMENGKMIDDCTGSTYNNPQHDCDHFA